MIIQHIYEHFAKIQDAKTVSRKTDLLSEIIEDAEVKRVLFFGLSPFITFGVTIAGLDAYCQNHNGSTLDEFITTCSEGTSGDFTEETWATLEDLSSRKLSGNQALKVLLEELNFLNTKASKLLLDILDKSPLPGSGATFVNKVKSGLIPQYKVMLADKLKPEKITYPCSVEPKYDGVRVNALVAMKDGQVESVEFKSREGMIFTSLGNLTEQITALALSSDMGKYARDGGLFIDGEVTVDDSFHSTVSAIKKQEVLKDLSGLKFHVFAVFSLNSFLSSAGSIIIFYKSMRTDLQRAISSIETGNIKLIDAVLVNSEEEIHGIYRNARAQKIEGVIVKQLNSKYFKRRNSGWMKIKANETVDLEVIGFNVGTGRLSDSLGALVVNYNGVSVDVGSGLTDAIRQEVWNDQEKYMSQIIEISYHEVTPDGSLRHPVFEGFRIDKSTSD